MPKWLTGTVVGVEEKTSDLRVFMIQIDVPEQLMFDPGQFVVMDLPISDKRSGRWRSYSIANTPNEDNIWEFCIVRIPDGGATLYFFEDVKIGTVLRMKPPQGTFSILNHLEKEVVLICTGTGVAPFRSMLQHITTHQIGFHQIHLIYGTRYKKNLLYHNEFLELSNQNNRFIYEPALSREAYNDYKGYVHNKYITRYADKESDIRFYLCGWQHMIDEAVNNLLIHMKYSPKQIVYELYG